MRILFIGNSYTYFNMMPNLFAMLARENGKDVTVESVTRGGWSLSWYVDVDNEQGRQLRSLPGKYDICFLQDNSVFPIVNFEAFRSGVSRISKLLADWVDTFILYETWGRKEGSEKLAELGLTREEMSQKLTSAYDTVGKEFGMAVSPVGQNFLKMGKRHPQIEIFDPDRTHPSFVGSCLSAITHYRTVFHELPEKLNCLGLLPEIQEAILTVVSEI